MNQTCFLMRRMFGLWILAHHGHLVKFPRCLLPVVVEAAELVPVLEPEPERRWFEIRLEL